MTRKNKKHLEAGRTPRNRSASCSLNSEHTSLASAEKKGTYGDYLRLLEFYRETHDEQAREIVIRWVDAESRGIEPLP